MTNPRDLSWIDTSGPEDKGLTFDWSLTDAQIEEGEREFCARNGIDYDAMTADDHLTDDEFNAKHAPKVH